MGINLTDGTVISRDQIDRISINKVVNGES